MKDYIEERAIEIADYIIATNATVRQAAKKFGVSKSTVHKDCVERLQEINPSLASEVTFTCMNIGLPMRKNTECCEKSGQRL